MSERVDRKLQEVAIARYAWRHEAEFAAGFLEDAGIPYRLQIDDPILGAPVSSAATLWVLGADERRARDLLELEGAPVRLTAGGRGARPSRTPAPRKVDRSHVGEEVGTSSGAPRRPGVFRRILSPPLMPVLSVRERALALLGAGGLAAAFRLFRWGEIHPIVSGVAVLLAAFLILAGIWGWAPRPLRRLLRALSGSAP